jgi:predicted amidohydrolase
MPLRVAAAQMRVTTDVEANRDTILRAIDFAAAEQADILLTPEGSLSGYTPRFDQPKVAEALAAVTGAAQARGVGLALGTCFIEPGDGQCYNELRFYERDGAYLGCHTKILRCGSMDEPPAGEINDYAAKPLRTFLFQGLTVGGLICNDLWANPACTPMPDPHLTQQLSRLGAKVILHAINGGRDGGEGSRVAWNFHEANVRMRAQAGKLWIVTVDNCDPAELPCSEQSGVAGPDGYWAFRTRPQGEHFFAYTICV